jgi:predicted dehydrogenase
MAALRFENGALGVIEASTAAFPGFLKRIEIHGSQGSAVLEEEDITQWAFAKKTKQDAAILERMAGKTESGGGAADPAAIGHHGHTAMFKDVLKAIKKGTRPLIDGHEGRRSVEVILAIYKAAESGRAVALPLKGDPVLKARKRNR